LLFRKGVKQLVFYCRFKNGNSIVVNTTTDGSNTVLKSDELAEHFAQLGY
jgi:hypothetical protein